MKSNCCNSKVRLASSASNSGTNYYICESCNKACDLIAERKPIAELVSDCCKAKLGIDCGVDGNQSYDVCSKCGKTCGAMTERKSIAERFKNEKLKGHQTWAHDECFLWLSEQPENSKTFTLQQVEQIAREAFTQGIKYLNNANAMPFDIYWQSKLKEWGEV